MNQYQIKDLEQVILDSQEAAARLDLACKRLTLVKKSLGANGHQQVLERSFTQLRQGLSYIEIGTQTVKESYHAAIKAADKSRTEGV